MKTLMITLTALVLISSTVVANEAIPTVPKQSLEQQLDQTGMLFQKFLSAVGKHLKKEFPKALDELNKNLENVTKDIEAGKLPTPDKNVIIRER